MAYNYPYGNGQQLNLDWFLNEWKNLLAAWEAEKNGIEGALQAEIDRAEAALADVLAARDAAAQSAANALESKNAAAQSAQDASGYLSTVQQNATAAQNAAQNAAQSESNAAESAQTALASKNTAANSERNAAQSEANANSSKNAAAQSAADALANKNAAAQSASDADASKSAAAQSAEDAENAASSVEASAEQIATNTENIGNLTSAVNDIRENSGTMTNDFSNWLSNLPLNKKVTQNILETTVNKNIVTAKQIETQTGNRAINLLTGESCPAGITTEYIKTNGIHIPDNSLVTISAKTIENKGQFINTEESASAPIAFRLYYASENASAFRGVSVAGYGGFSTGKQIVPITATTDLYILPTFFRTGNTMIANDEITFRYDINIYSRIAKRQISANTFFNIEDLLFYATAQIEAGAIVNVGTNANLMTIAQALNNI